MARATVNGSTEVVLDSRVIGVYAQSISDLLADVLYVAIYDVKGALKWSNADSMDPTQGVLAQAQRLDFEAPSKRSLGGDNVAYDFPLLQDDTPPLVLRIVLHGLDPHSLRHVADATSSAIACLSRQIRIDTSLTSRMAIPADRQLAYEVVAELNTARLGNILPDDIQRLSDVCLKITDCSAIIVRMPGHQIDISSVRAADSKMDLTRIGTKLLTLQKKRRRPASVQLNLPTGKSCIAMCAPIMINNKTVEGIVALVDNERKPWHSTVVRSLSAKVASLGQNNTRAVSLASRVDLLSAMDGTLASQSTMQHSLIYFDVDKMHAINDAFGYSRGDSALSRCKQILLDCSGANDTAAHLGSDRFALFLPGASDDTASAKAGQILRLIAQETIEDNDKALSLSASAGISCSQSISKGGEELLILAELAARGAQDRGGNQYAGFQDVDGSIIQRRSDVDKVGFLQTALIENRFELHAQRIAAINAEPIQKFELLARLSDKSIDNGSAHNFLSAAERYQMMAALDRWVINSALQTLSEANNTLEVNLSTFCINVSAQSLQDDRFVDHIESRIADSGVPPDILCFEITETSLVRYIDRAQRFVSRIQRLGCQVALDDFGTGYSSFAYLKTLPVNILKIDGTFVRDILECSLSKTIVSSVVRIAEDIGAVTVAEHVESELVRAQLKDLGVHYGQGFVIHRPEPLLDVLRDLGNPDDYLPDLCESVDLRSDSLEILVRNTRV